MSVIGKGWSHASIIVILIGYLYFKIDKHVAKEPYHSKYLADVVSKYNKAYVIIDIGHMD